jgi:hypothetical protein
MHFLFTTVISMTPGLSVESGRLITIPFLSSKAPDFIGFSFGIDAAGLCG